jgi:hypothetical protein
MSKWLSAGALALLLAAPALAQSDKPASSDRQQMPPGSTTASGDVTPSAEAETKSSGSAVAPSKNPASGAGGLSRPSDRAIGASKPGDDSAEAYKKDFEKK